MGLTSCCIGRGKAACFCAKIPHKSRHLHHAAEQGVKGLYAKNCIDILGVVDHISDVVKEVDNFVALGYVYNGEYGITG